MNEEPHKRSLTDNIILHIKIQKMIKTWKKMTKKSKHRLNILKEWAQTQQSYIKDLYLIIQKIQKPFCELKLITQEEDRILFPNLNSIIKLSEQMLTELKKFIKQWNPHTTMIGEIIINFHKYFLIYRDYCNNFMRGQQIIKEVRSKPEAEKIQASLMMDFESYIIKPVQRPPKYQLLLRQYRKALNPKHPDYENLGIAIQKYHEVNEQNNQSMELQIRNKMMIKLDGLYGGIISNTRYYLCEQIAQSINFKVKIYIFNDLIVVVKIIKDEKEECYKKIFLDDESYAEAPMDGKYFINKLFICGKEENIHLNFLNISTRDRIFHIIKKLIFDLYYKAQKRKSLMVNIIERKKLKTKIKVTQLQDMNDKLYAQLQLKLRIMVVGVEKRPMSHISSDTVYIIKIQSPYPSNIFQYSYIPFEDLVLLEKQIRKNYKIPNLPVLDERPDTMNYYDIKKNKTKIIQYRQIFIERFLNFVFRCEELLKQFENIANILKINEQLWKFASQGSQECHCSICSDFTRESLNISSFESKRFTAKGFLGERLSRESQEMQIYTSNTSKFAENFCVFNSFLMTSRIAETDAEQLDTLERRLAWLDCKMGRIDYSLLPKDDIGNNIKVNVYLLSLKEDDYITLHIGKQTTVQEVIEFISLSYKIKNLRDFGLFLDYQGIPRLLDRDQRLFSVLESINYEFDDKKTEKSEGGFWGKVQNLKKWGEEIISGKKSKVYLQKYLFVESKLEKKACEENPQRYSIIVEEIFYRFKNETLILSVNDMKKLCALFYLLNNLQKIGNITSTNFQIQKLKNLVPESKWHMFDNSLVFEKDIFTQVNKYQERMKESTLTVNLVYSKVIDLVNDILGWNSFFYQVTNYDPPSLPGSATELLLGISRHYLTIIRPKQLAPLLEIPLSQLEYKVTAFSIFIQTEERILRFDGRMMYDIKKLIEIYKTLANKFDKK